MRALNAFFASTSSCISTMPVTPCFGRITLLTDPNLENKFEMTGASIPTARFLTRMTVLLLICFLLFFSSSTSSSSKALKLMPLSSKNFLVWSTICVSPKAILTAIESLVFVSATRSDFLTLNWEDMTSAAAFAPKKRVFQVEAFFLVSLICSSFFSLNDDNWFSRTRRWSPGRMLMSLPWKTVLSNSSIAWAACSGKTKVINANPFTLLVFTSMGR